jgi:hypothetical protein
MAERTIYQKLLQGEVTPRDAAAVTGHSEQEIEEWLAARRHGYPKPRPGPRRRSARVIEAVRLYREVYRGLPLAVARRALREQHCLSISATALREALRAENLLPMDDAPRSARVRAEPAPRLGRPPKAHAQSAPQPVTHRTDALMADRLQVWSDALATLNAAVRDRLVDWRQGRQPIAAATTAFDELVAYLTRLPK